MTFGALKIVGVELTHTTSISTFDFSFKKKKSKKNCGTYFLGAISLGKVVVSFPEITFQKIW